MGALGNVVGLSTATGPVVGGVFLALAGNHEGWRSAFYVDVPIRLVALVLAARLLPCGSSAVARGTQFRDSMLMTDPRLSVP